MKMASAAPKNRVYLFRLQTLIIDGGLLVLRHIFDHKLQLQNISFSVCLNQEKGTLTRLRSRNTITQYQYDFLYPASGQPPTTSDLDITLIICLLRNLKICALNKKFNWNIPPQAGDTCLEADIYRLKQYRNEIAHIATTTGINLMNFTFKWTEIEQILLRLNSSISNPVPDLQKTIYEMKTSPLDSEAEDRIEETIKQWSKMEKCIEADVKLVKTDVQVLKDEMKKSTTNTQKRIIDIESQISKIKEHDLQQTHKDAKEEYLKKRKDMKEDLISLYRQHYHTLPLSPLIEECDAPLNDFYVKPDINILESHRSLGRGSEITKSKIKSLHDVFYKKTKSCREIYLEAKAGLGKTAFSKRLALTWCQAHKCNKNETKCFEKGETNAMSEFEFVFSLSLRNCSEECDIDQMIRKQILPLLAHKSDIIETVLADEKCLVILDGLDEWSHPTSSCAYGLSEIPHRKAREYTTIITTARPWKLSLINLKASQIDLRLELDGLSQISRGKLKTNGITLLNHSAEKATEDQIKDFDSTVADKGVSDLESVPLLLMYLLCLWCDKIELGDSKCIIYCQIVELLLKRTFKKFPAIQNTCLLPSTSNIPQCFDAQTSCKENYTFLSSLGQLAFETLFCKTRENTLVFDRLVVEKYLNTDLLSLSLRSGIITQDKEVRLTSEKQKTSFSHKTVQEFFAALYISTCSDQDKVLKEILSSCNCVKDILEMSEVFIFTSGINPQLFSSVSEKLMKVINDDEIMSTYRSVTAPADYNKYVTPVKELQDMFISCMREITGKSEFRLCLQDLIFNKSCQKETYYTNLQRLAIQNLINLKSIRIEIDGIRSLSEIITECGLSDPAVNCQKILYRGECKEAEIIPLLSSSAKCITIISSEWRENSFEIKDSSWSHKWTKIVQNNNQLQAINIQSFTFNHDVLGEFLNFLVKRKSMKDIELYGLFCNDHKTSCSGFNFDLSRHTDLRILGLNNIPLSQLNVNVSLLEECTVGDFSKPGIVKTYLRNISAASKLQTIYFCNLKSSDDIQTMLQTLSLLVTLKRIYIWDIHLGGSLLPHEIVKIEYVRLWGITMSSLSLSNLVCWIEEDLLQHVTVEMRDCKITPEIDFEKIKVTIQKSEKFVVVNDGELLSGCYLFEFKSIN